MIKGIETDKDGFVWTATDKGVLRFDGQKSTFYKDEIAGGFAKAILRTASGKLLVLHDFGLTEVISNADSILFKLLIPGKQEDSEDALHYPKTIYEDKKGQIWIGENQSVVCFKDGQIKKYRFTKNLDFGVLTRSFAFAEDPTGKLWVISHSGFLFYLDETTNQFVEQLLNEKLTEATCMTIVAENKVWVGANDGIWEIGLNASQNAQPVKKIGGPAQISCALLVNGKDFFAGTWNGGLYYSSLLGEMPVFEKIDQLPFDHIVGTCFDKNNGLWVTGRESSVLLKPVLFENFDLETTYPATITSLNLSQNGNVLVIGDENIINKQAIYELENGKIVWQMKLPVNPFGNIPLAVYEEGENIWVGDLDGGVYYFNKISKEPIKIKEIKNSSHPISKITKDKFGNIWVAGNSNLGLAKISKDLKINFYKDIGLSNSKIIYPAPDGELYAGGSGAGNYLFKYNARQDDFENISNPSNRGLKDNFEVKDLVQDKNGLLYLATTDGVFTSTIAGQSKSILNRVNLNKVPANEPANALAFAPDGTLWIATTSGLVAFTKTSSFLFDKASGLPANSFTDNGLVHDKDGNLWIGTTSGLSYFKSEKSNFPLTPSPIIDVVKVDGKNQNKETFLATPIPYHAGVEFNFLSLSFPADQVMYKIRLLEKDTNWSEPEHKKQWYLSSLDPGNYTLQVTAQQQEGMRWSKPTAFAFSIEKPWYKKPLFILLLLMLSIALIIIIARLYNLRLIKQRNNLELIIKKRTDEINKQKNEIIDQQKKLLEQNEKMQALKEDQFKNELEYKNKQLTTYTLNLIQKNQTLKELRLKINQVIRGPAKSSYQEMRKLLNLIDYSFRKDEDWENFKLFFEQVHAGFFENLISHHPKLTSHDLRHCALIRLNLSIEEMATIIGISADSIKTARFRLKKKMDLDSQTDLLEYLMTI